MCPADNVRKSRRTFVFHSAIWNVTAEGKYAQWFQPDVVPRRIAANETFYDRQWHQPLQTLLPISLRIFFPIAEQRWTQQPTLDTAWVVLTLGINPIFAVIQPYNTRHVLVCLHVTSPGESTIMRMLLGSPLAHFSRRASKLPWELIISLAERKHCRVKAKYLEDLTKNKRLNMKLIGEWFLVAVSWSFPFAPVREHQLLAVLYGRISTL